MTRPLKDHDPEKWRSNLHTFVKHELFTSYFRVWVKILGSTFKDIGYFDGFAGRGIYPDTGNFGSPILALQALSENHKSFNSCMCIFVERNFDNHRCLEDLIEKNKQTFSPSITIEVHKDEFEIILPKYLDFLDDRPFFVFLDPFGFNLSFEAIEQILSYDKNEVFITLMTKNIRRFISSDPHRPALIRLMGKEEHLRGLKNQEGIVEKYIELLDGIAKYTLKYAVGADEKKENIYYLVHATNHFKGFEIMKNTMFKHGRGEGDFAYRGILDSKNKSLDIFVDPTKGEKTVYEYIKANLWYQKRTYQEVLEEIYVQTNYIEEHLRQVLQEMEKNQEIQVLAKRKGKRKGGFKSKDIILFSPPEKTGSDSTPMKPEKNLEFFLSEALKPSSPRREGMANKKARSIAGTLIHKLKGADARIKIAGSIRRQKPYVKDIELVVKLSGSKTQFENKIQELEKAGRIEVRKNGSRYKQLVLLDQQGQELIKVDLFIVRPPSQWGVIYLLRTGSAAFSKRFVTEIKPEFRVKDGVLQKRWEVTDEMGTRTVYQSIKTPTEKAVFEAVGWEYVEPENRIE